MFTPRETIIQKDDSSGISQAYYFLLFQRRCQMVNISFFTEWKPGRVFSECDGFK